jgi:hypothetical protein
MNILPSALLALVCLTVSSPAAFWSSGDFRCEINLPDSLPGHEDGWGTAGSTEEGTMVGSRKNDRTAFLFLGYVDLAKRPNFHLNDKTVTELEKRYIPDASGFHHSTERIMIHGYPGYKTTGSNVYQGEHFSVVIYMCEANNLIYQVVGMKAGTESPLKDADIRNCLDSFRVRK